MFQTSDPLAAAIPNRKRKEPEGGNEIRGGIKKTKNEIAEALKATLKEEEEAANSVKEVIKGTYTK